METGAHSGLRKEPWKIVMQSYAEAQKAGSQLLHSGSARRSLLCGESGNGVWSMRFGEQVRAPTKREDDSVLPPPFDDVHVVGS